MWHNVRTVSVKLKPVVWLGDTLRELTSFPARVQDEVGYALFLAQRGDKHIAAKPLRGLRRGVREVVSGHRGDTFRAVYTVRLVDRVFVLHVFQKKSKQGSATPQADVNLIRRRLKQAIAMSEGRE